MKRTVIIATALLVLALPASAQSRFFDITGWASWVDPQGDLENGVSDFEFDADQGYGIAGNFFLSDRFSLEIGVISVGPDIQGKTSDATIGNLTFGELEMVPITGTLQLHFMPNGRIDPYIGAGLAYVLVDNLDGTADLRRLGIDRIDFDDDYGYVLNAGLSFDLTSMLAINLDAKYVPLESSARVVFPGSPQGTPVDVEINPLILSAGISLQF